MAREYAFETVGSAAFPGLPTTTDPFDYTDTMYNLLESEDYKVGEYPDTMFWGGVDRIDAPYMYPACITFDYEGNTLYIDALQGKAYDGVYKDDVQLSYAYTIKDDSSYGDFMALPNDWTVSINDNGEDVLSWDTYKSYVIGMNTTANNSRFVSKVALNRRIIIPYLWFCPKTAWNVAISGSPSEPDTVLDLCSCTDWESGTVSYTNRETGVTSTVNTSDCIICGVKIMQCGAIRDFGTDGGIRMLGRPSDKFRSIYDATKVMNPINSLFYNYNHDAVLDYGNLHCASVQIPLAAEDYPYSIGGNSDTTSYTFYLKSYLNNLYMGDLGGFWSYYIDPTYQWHKSGKHAAAPMIYNGPQSFDISEIMAFSAAGMYRRAYVDGDSYIISTQTFTNTYRTYQYNTKITIRPVYRSLDDVYKFIAGLGMAFMIGNIYTSSTTVNKTILDDSVFAPVLDEHNVYHGQYTRGAENADNDFFDKSDSTDTDYIPSEPEPEEGKFSGDEIIPELTLSAGAASNFITMYCLTQTQLSTFGSNLWSNILDPNFIKSMAVVWSEDWSLDPAHIVDYITSLRFYPFSIQSLRNDYWENTGQNKLYIGRGVEGVSTGNNVLRLKCLSVSVYGGSLSVPAHDQDFRMMEPFTEIILNVPFCGSCNLKPSEVAGENIALTYIIDLSTGDMMAYCWTTSTSPNKIVAVLNGKIGCDVQYTGGNFMQGFIKGGSAVVEAAKTMVGTAIGAGVGGNVEPLPEKVSESNVELTAKGIEGVGKDAETLVSSTLSSSPPATRASSFGFAALGQLKPYIEYIYKDYVIPDNYRNVYGFACNFSSELSELEGTGFTVCRNVEVNTLKCTVDEQIRIKQLLETGVFL